MKTVNAELLTRKQVAALFQVSIDTVIRMEKRGILPVVRLGLVASPRYKRSDVEALIAR